MCKYVWIVVICEICCTTSLNEWHEVCICVCTSKCREYVWVLCSSAFYDDSLYRWNGKIHQFYLVLYIGMLPNKNICLEIVTCNNPIGSRTIDVIWLLKTNLVSDWLVKIWLHCLAVFFVHYISNFLLFLAMMKLRIIVHEWLLSRGRAQK